MFKYLGRLLDQSDNDCAAVLKIISKARQVKAWLRKILWREGADPSI